MLTGSVLGIFATEEGGVPKPSVDSIDVRLNGVYGERIRDTKHHGGPKRAVCILSNQTLQFLQQDGHPISGGSTGENLLIDIDEDSLRTSSASGLLVHAASMIPVNMQVVFRTDKGAEVWKK